MTDKDRELIKKWMQPCAAVPVDIDTVRILLNALKEQQEQEPVAWVDESAIRWLADRKGKVSAHCTTKLSAARSCEQSMPIYTTPPRREWVGLTDEEIMSLVPVDGNRPATTFARSIEAKLWEKNNV